MHMDLRENELTTVSNVYRLTALETCDLSKLIAVVFLTKNIC